MSSNDATLSITMTTESYFTLPASEVRQLLGKPDASVEELVEILEGDMDSGWTPALAERLDHYGERDDGRTEVEVDVQQAQ